MLNNDIILIISNEDDQTTNLVIDWLVSMKQKYIRINDSTELTLSDFTMNNSETDFLLSTEGLSFRYSNIKSIWYRRGLFNISIKTIKNKNTHREDITALSIYLGQEYLHFNYAILDLLWQKCIINKSSDIHTNKISNLEIAKKSGLDIPKTIVTSDKSKIISFFKDCPNGVISKPIHFGTYYDSDVVMSCYTNELMLSDLERLNDSIWPSLLQEKLDKYIELRIFYLNGMCFTSAIFSQNDTKTSVDFRKYNYEKPNRTPPFKLPQKIIDSINIFMTTINMNCGSLDIVLTKDLRYYFLEVNPVGQFQQVSLPCNYNIEKYVAEYLINQK